MLRKAWAVRTSVNIINPFNLIAEIFTMNPLSLQYSQPQFVPLAHAAPNVYSNDNICPAKNITITLPCYGDNRFSEVAFGLIHFLKQLEQDKIKVFPKPTITCPHPLMNPLCIWVLQQMSHLSYFIDLFDAFESHPHLQVFHKFARENSSLLTSPQNVPSTTWENLFYRLRGELYAAKAKLQSNKFQAEVQYLQNNQKTVFRRVMQTQKQANCIFLELPLIVQTEPPFLKTQEEAEKSAAKMLKDYFKWLHKTKALTEKLYNIQWRIVRGLDHKLTAQAFVYILGDEEDHLRLLKEQWELICMDYQLQGFFPEPKHTHCYDGKGVVQKAWLELIERVHQPIGFYRYSGNGITYMWKEYTGNI